MPHARKVLILFGRAYGRLPATGDLPQEQMQFVEQAVTELSQNGKVVSVRLALLAEMVKGKPWVSGTAPTSGGTCGHSRNCSKRQATPRGQKTLPS